jgi:hypothetical protein
MIPFAAVVLLGKTSSAKFSVNSALNDGPAVLAHDAVPVLPLPGEGCRCAREALIEVYEGETSSSLCEGQTHCVQG